MRVATWNLWWRFGPWEERQPAITATLNAVDADVILLQEVFGPSPDHHDQAHALANELDMHWVATNKVHSNPSQETRPGSPSGRSPFGSPNGRSPFGNAILSRWPIVDSQQRFLPGSDGQPSHRSALWALLEHPDGPQPVATTHLDWHYDASVLRQAQLDDLIRWLANHHRTLGNRSTTDDGRGLEPHQHRALILGGDFNAVPESDEIRRLVGLSAPYGSKGDAPRVFTDAWAACGDGPGYTWTRDNEHTADAQWPRRRLDYLLSSWPRPKPTGNPLACKLEGLQPIDGVVPSDHACVVADFDDRPAFT